MKVRTLTIGLIVIFLGSFFINQPGAAREPDLEPVGSYGAIDWVKQKVTATGIGVPSGETAQNPAQARVMARRAAEVVARRNLLEVVKGIRIDSRTSVMDYAVKEDIIVTSVKGVLENSTIEGYRYLTDGSVEATVSMPISGPLGGVLLQIPARAGTAPATTPATEAVEKRILMLEERIRSLEEKLGGFKRLNFEQEQAILLFKQLLTAWRDYQSSIPQFMPAAYVTDSDLAALRNEIIQQGGKIAELSKRLDDMTGRLKALETAGRQPDSAPKPMEPRTAPSYTGLVIDARQTGFKPCLKPEILFQGQLVYPGDYVNLEKAIRNGYVRYYRKIEGAQQSAQAGNLPLTVTAREGSLGQGSLEIDAEAYGTLRKMMQTANNFMTNCNVVIVF
ncbi:MAG: hypothetical protein AB1427_07415 [Thermodesulfobacteriota bacterium]